MSSNNQNMLYKIMNFSSISIFTIFIIFTVQFVDVGAEDLPDLEKTIEYSNLPIILDDD